MLCMMQEFLNIMYIAASVRSVLHSGNNDTTGLSSIQVCCYMHL